MVVVRLIAIPMFVLFSIAIAALIFGDSDLEAVLKRELQGLNLQSPRKDLEGNIAKNDLRFIGLHGFTTYVPGLGEENYLLIEQFGISMFEGSGDAVESKDHLKLIRAAENYAKVYNRALEAYINSLDPYVYYFLPNIPFNRLSEIDLNQFPSVRAFFPYDLSLDHFILSTINAVSPVQLMAASVKDPPEKYVFYAPQFIASLDDKGTLYENLRSIGGHWDNYLFSLYKSNFITIPLSDERFRNLLTDSNVSRFGGSGIYTKHFVFYSGDHVYIIDRNGVGRQVSKGNETRIFTLNLRPHALGDKNDFGPYGEPFIQDVMFDRKRELLILDLFIRDSDSAWGERVVLDTLNLKSTRVR